MIFSQAQDTVNNSGMGEAATSSFNNKFLKYEGTRKGSEVKALINEAIASNADDNNSSNYAKVQILKVATADATTGTDITNDSSKILTSHTYEVKLKVYDQGRIKTITVFDKSTTT